METRGRGPGVWGQKETSATPGPKQLGGAKRPVTRVCRVAPLKSRARIFKPETTGAVEGQGCWRDGGWRTAWRKRTLAPFLLALVEQLLSGHEGHMLPLLIRLHPSGPCYMTAMELVYTLPD